MVPSDDHLGSAGLLEHIEHLRLKHGVDGLDGDAGARLRHGEDVDDFDGVVVDKVAQHEAHHLHGDARAPVLEHFQQREGGDVDGLGRVHDGAVGLTADAARLGLVKEALQTVHEGGSGLIGGNAGWSGYRRGSGWE